MPLPDSTVNRARTTRPSLLACLECRTKHVKCDSKGPRCGRCLDRGFECSYTPSRRGLRTDRRAKTAAVPNPPASKYPTAANNGQLRAIHNLGSVTPPLTAQTTSGSPSPTTIEEAADSFRQNIYTTVQPIPAYDKSSNYRHGGAEGPCQENNVDLFYSFFYPNHPFLMPYSSYEAAHYPLYLKNVIRFVGSHYAYADTAEYRHCAVKGVGDTSKRNPQMIQALLLLAIVLHARYEVHEAAEHLTRTVQMAIVTGLNQPEYATTYGEQSLLIEESLRRTWWELYIVDGYLAALHQQSSFNCHMVNIHPPLPCGEFQHGAISGRWNLRRLDHFEDRHFSDYEYEYSSFCFRVEAIRHLARVLATSGNPSTGSTELQALDNVIVGWKHHLSREKQDPVDVCGPTDSMVFQAHMYIQCARIILHFPRAKLPLTVPSTVGLECATQPWQTTSATTQHGTKAIATSECMAHLAAIPPTIENHSPFLVCGLALACVVQPSAFSAHSQEQMSLCIQQHRDHVTLILGVLKSLSRRWKVAEHVSSRLKFVAQCLFKPQEATTKEFSAEQTQVRNDEIRADDAVNMSWLDFMFNNAVNHHQYLAGAAHGVANPQG